VVKTCDVHGDDTDATDTVAFGIGAERFEIDLCDQHAGELRETLARYAGLGRRVRAGGGRSPSNGSGAEEPKRKGDRARTKYGFSGADLTSEERDFAVAQGWAGRGRIKDEIMQAIAEKRGIAVA